MKDLLTLRQVCETLQISRRAIQGYEAIGLLRPVGKNSSGFLQYDPEVLSRIRSIRQYQTFGFSLKDIAMMDSMTQQERKEKLIKQRKILLEKEKELNEAVKQITEMIERI